jgi:hypothetical protein
MKIISKFKDFYDYMAVDHDADLVYVRDFRRFTDIHVCSDFNHVIDKAFGAEKKHISFLRNYLAYGASFAECNLLTVTYGIYPYIYAVPMVYLYDEKMGFVLTRGMIDEIIGSDDERKALTSIIYRETRVSPKSGKVFDVANRYKIKDYLSNFPSKAECPELFFRLGAPVFLRKTGKSETGVGVLTSGTLYQDRSFNETTYFLTNIVFKKLNVYIIRPFSDELYDINTYNRIENFLWASKTEPVSEPDNKTKILNHGFDLKTSFRKM